MAAGRPGFPQVRPEIADQSLGIGGVLFLALIEAKDSLFPAALTDCFSSSLSALTVGQSAHGRAPKVAF